MAGEPSSTHNVFLLHLSESGTTEGNSGLLLGALRESRIRTFTIEDAEELLTPRGDEITQALVTAIQASKIAIVVLTGGYRHVSLRRWNVLACLLDYFQRNPQLIIPVYYVDRRIAHADLFGFDDNFEKRKKYLEKTGKDVYKLSKVMAQVDDLPGWDFNWFENNIDQFNRKIASQVSKMLNRDLNGVAVYPVVGLESRLEEVWRLLRLKSSNREFLNIGFYGMQGIGKSTLARAVYDSIAHLFEVSCFLRNIRQNSSTHELVGFQKMLLSQISGETDIKNVSEGVSKIKDRLCEKDVLLILDDVDSLDQLEALGRGPGWRFSSDSRVIITTQNKDLLTYHGNDMLLYDVQELNHKDIQSIQGALTYNDIQSIQGASTTSRSDPEALHISLRVTEETPLNDTESSQTESHAGVMSQMDFQEWMLILVFLVSCGVGLSCNALSSFKDKEKNRWWWPLFKLFPYVVAVLAVLATILRRLNQHVIIRRFKWCITYLIFLGITVYAEYYNRAVEPGIWSAFSNGAFALTSVSLSKLLGVYELGMFCYFLGCFTIHLMIVKWYLIFVAIFMGVLLFDWHSSSEPFLLTRIIRRFRAIPP